MNILFVLSPKSDTCEVCWSSNRVAGTCLGFFEDLS